MDPCLVVPEASAAFGGWIFSAWKKKHPSPSSPVPAIGKMVVPQVVQSMKILRSVSKSIAPKKMATGLTACLMKNVQFTVRSLRCAVVGAGVTSSKSWTLSARHSWHMKGDE